MDANERDLMIRTVYGEANDQPDEGQRAVAHVILNRMRNSGQNATQVMLAPKQFEPWSTRRRELVNLSPDSDAYKSAAANVDLVLAGAPDPTGGKTHFLEPNIVRGRVGRGQMGWPGWARGKGQQIGDHVFYDPPPGDTYAPQPEPAAYTTDDVAKAYGINAPAAQAIQEAAPQDQDTILKNYGVSKPEPVPQKPVQVDVIPANASPGKIPPPPEPPITPQETAQGTKRGYPAQFLAGMPIIGPAVNMVEAAGTAASQQNTNPGTSFGNRFSAALEAQRRADVAFAQENPISSTAVNLAGSIGPYAAMGSTALGARLLGGGAAPTWGARVYSGAAGGAGISAIDAAMRGENPVTAAEIGAAGGILGPTLTEGARGATRAGATYLWPRPGPLANVPRAGISTLQNALEGETPASIAAGRARMGPAGFLGDLTPGLTDVAGALADTPGPTKTVIREAYRQRSAEQAQRVEGALNEAMGPPTNVVEHEKYLTEIRKQAADPLYQQWRSTQVHPTKDLQALIPRLEASGAFDEAERLSGISGDPINRKFFVGGPRKEYPTTQTWDYVKRGLDSKIEQAYSSGNRTMARELVKLKGEMVDEIEKTPAGAIWRQARSEFADRSAIIDQLKAGRDTFLGGRSGTSVDEMREELRGLNGPELAARLQSARSAVAEAMGDRTEGAAAVRSKLLAPNNQEKLRLLIGDEKANDLISKLQQEKFLSDQHTNVLGNMNTGASAEMRKARREMFAPPETPRWLANLDLTKPLSLVPPALLPHNVFQAEVGQAASRAAPALGPLLTTRPGQAMDDLVNALRGESARVANVQRRAAPFINALSGTVSGPGASTYRRAYENQSPR